MRLPADPRFAALALSAAALLLALLGLARPGEPPTRTVVVAAKALPAGTVLEPGDLRLTRLAAPPPGAVPAGTPVLGRRLVAPLLAGDPVLRTLLSPAGPPAFVVTLPATAVVHAGQVAAIAFLPDVGPPRLLAPDVRITVPATTAGGPAASVLVPASLATLLLAAEHAWTVVVLPESP